MADIKQIKIGDTTYNIEPYTNYLPKTGGTIDGDLTTTGNINIGGDLRAVTVITDGFVEAEEGIISYAGLQVDGDTSVGGNLTTTGSIVAEEYISTPEIYVGADDEVFLDSSGITINGESVALKSDIPTDYLPKTGGNVSGHIYLTGANPGSSTANTSQIVFGTQNENHLALTSNTRTLVLNPSISDTSNQIVLYLDKQSSFPSGISSPNGTISAKTLKQDGKSVITSSTATTLTTSSAAPTAVESTTTTSIQKYVMSFSDGVLYIRPDGEVSVSLGTHTHTTSAHTHTVDTHKH